MTDNNPTNPTNPTEQPVDVTVTVPLAPEQIKALANGHTVNVTLHMVPLTSGVEHHNLGDDELSDSYWSDSTTPIPLSRFNSVPASVHNQQSELGPDQATSAPGDDDTAHTPVVTRRAIISLDSTSNEAEALFRSAIVSIDGIPGNQVDGISPLYHVSELSGPDMMSAVIMINTKLSARQLIAALGTVESTHADQLDLDLIDVEGVTCNDSDCTVPWPSASHHAAVLAPWLDMDPEARLGGEPVSFLLAMAPDAGRVGMLSDKWIIGGTL